MRGTFNTVDLNHSLRFIVPFLGISIQTIEKYCLNAYFGDTSYPNLTNHVFLLFEYYDDPLNKRLVKELTSLPDYEFSYQPSESLIIYVYKIPESFQKDYELFRQSKYSKISDENKKAIKKFFSLNPTNDLYGILYRTEARRKHLEKYFSECPDGTEVSHVSLPEDAEYSSILNPEKEIFSMDTLLKQLK